MRASLSSTGGSMEGEQRRNQGNHRVQLGVIFEVKASKQSFDILYLLRIRERRVRRFRLI